MKDILEKLKAFNEERAWGQFHTPENLAKSISIEAGELLECFQWNSDYDKECVCDELADVMLYCIMLADKIDVDMKKEMLRKIEVNRSKYPVAKCKGSSEKYSKLGE